jgi:hypothetical protein
MSPSPEIAAAMWTDLRSNTMATLLAKYPLHKNYIYWLQYCESQGCWSIHHVRQIEDNHRRNLLDAPPGFIGLLDSDKDYLLQLLHQNDGSEVSIRSIRDWCLKYAHSMHAIIVILTRFVQLCIQTNHGTLPAQLIHTLYAINDLLFRREEAYNKGPYTELLDDHVRIKVHILACIWPRLIYMLRIICQGLANPLDKVKIHDLVDLWWKSGIVDAMQAGVLQSVLNELQAFPEPPVAPLIMPSPCIKAPPPPPPPPLAPPIIPAFQGDLESISVGCMADVVRASLRRGHERYAPLDPAALKQVQVETSEVFDCPTMLTTNY